METVYRGMSLLILYRIVYRGLSLCGYNIGTSFRSEVVATTTFTNETILSVMLLRSHNKMDVNRLYLLFILTFTVKSSPAQPAGIYYGIRCTLR